MFITGFYVFKKVIKHLPVPQAKEYAQIIAQKFIQSLESNENYEYFSQLFSAFTEVSRLFPFVANNELLCKVATCCVECAKIPILVDSINEFFKSLFSINPLLSLSLSNQVAEVFIILSDQNLMKGIELLDSYFNMMFIDSNAPQIDEKWLNILGLILRKANDDNYEIIYNLLPSICKFFGEQITNCVDNAITLLNDQELATSSVVIRFVESCLDFYLNYDVLSPLIEVFSHFPLSSTVHFYGSFLDYTPDVNIIDFITQFFICIEPSQFVDVINIQRLGYKLLQRKSAIETDIVMKIFMLRLPDNPATYDYIKKSISVMHYENSKAFIDFIKENYLSLIVSDRLYLTESFLQFCTQFKENINQELIFELGTLLFNSDNYTEDCSYEFAIPIAFFVRNYSEYFSQFYENCFNLSVQCIAQETFESMLSGSILMDELAKVHAIPLENISEVLNVLSLIATNENLRWMIRGASFLAISHIFINIEIDEHYLQLFGQLYESRNVLYDRNSIEDLETTDALIAILISLTQIVKHDDSYLDKLFTVVIELSFTDEFPEILLSNFLQTLVFLFATHKNETEEVIAQNMQIESILESSNQIMPEYVNVIRDLRIPLDDEEDY